MGRTMHACLALLLLACVGAAQLIYPDNDAHALMTALPGESATLFFESYFYSISEDVHNRIYEAVYTTSNRALSPAPFLQQDGVVGALAFDDRANLLFWVQSSLTNTSVFVKNCSSAAPPSLIAVVPAFVDQLSLDTTNDVIYLSAGPGSGGDFYSLGYNASEPKHILKAVTDGSPLLFSQLTFDPTTGGFYFVQIDDVSGAATVMYVADDSTPPELIYSLNSTLLVAVVDPGEDMVIFTEGLNVYRCTLSYCIEPELISPLPETKLPLLALAFGSSTYALSQGGCVYILSRTPENLSVPPSPVIAPLTVDAMDTDPIHNLVYWNSPYNIVEYLNLTSMQWGLLISFPSDTLLLDIAADAGRAQTYVSTSVGLYRLQVGVAPALITLQNYKRSIEFICVDAYFSNLYFYDRMAKQIHRCKLDPPSTICESVTLLSSASYVDAMDFGAGSLYWSGNGTIKSLDANADTVVTAATTHASIAPMGLAQSAATPAAIAWLDASRPGYAQLMSCFAANCQPQVRATVPVHTTEPRLVATANGTYCLLTSPTGNVTCLVQPNYAPRTFTALRGQPIIDFAFDAQHNAIVATAATQPPSIMVASLVATGNSSLAHCAIGTPTLALGPLYVLDGDIFYANQALSRIEVCIGGCPGCLAPSVAFAVPDGSTTLAMSAAPDGALLVATSAGSIYMLTQGNVTLVRDVLAPVAGVAYSNGAVLWSHTVQGCVLAAPLTAPAAPYATVYAGASAADGLQVFFLNGTVSAAWRYPPDEPNTVQLVSLAAAALPVQVVIVTAAPLADFVYFQHIDKPYYRTVPVDLTIAWTMVAGIVTLAIIIASVQFVYKTCRREEVHRAHSTPPPGEHGGDEEDDKHPLLQSA